MKKLVIIGTGNFARLLHYYLTDCDKRKVVSFSVNEQYVNSSCDSFLGLPVVPLETLTKIYDPESHEVIMGVGYSGMNNVRKSLFEYCKKLGYDVASFIHPSSLISKDAVIGEGNIILENITVQPFVRIGKGNLFWDNIAIAHDGKVGDFNAFSGNVGLSGFVEVGNNCFLGKHSMVFDHVKLADYTLLGAGAYAKRNTKEYDVIVPAKSITLEGKRSTDFL